MKGYSYILIVFGTGQVYFVHLHAQKKITYPDQLLVETFSDR